MSIAFEIFCKVKIPLPRVAFTYISTTLTKKVGIFAERFLKREKVFVFLKTEKLFKVWKIRSVEEIELFVNRERKIKKAPCLLRGALMLERVYFALTWLFKALY